MAIFGTSETTDMSTKDYSVDSQETDGANGLNEITYQPEWTKWHGYYRKIDILAAIIDTKARWTTGDSYKADATTTAKLSKIKGFGKDTFNSIVYNLLRTSLICGDSFAEIVRDKAGRLINLKPLNPGSLKIVVDESGIIKQYVQTAQIGVKGEVPFTTKEIFHLAYNRVADEIHGFSDIEKVEDPVKKLKELIEDNATIIHRYIKPLSIHKVKTDDATEIRNYKTKLDNAFKNTENLIVPDDTVAEIINVSNSASSILDPMPLIASLKQDITKAMGVPEVVLGWAGGSTEASSKILYLSFEQMVKFHQKWLEEEIEEQLGLKVNFNFPASIEPGLQQDQKKDKGQIEPKGMEANKDE